MRHPSADHALHASARTVNLLPLTFAVGIITHNGRTNGVTLAGTEANGWKPSLVSTLALINRIWAGTMQHEAVYDRSRRQGVKGRWFKSSRPEQRSFFCSDSLTPTPAS